MLHAGFLGLESGAEHGLALAGGGEKAFDVVINAFKGALDRAGEIALRAGALGADPGDGVLNLADRLAFCFCLPESFGPFRLVGDGELSVAGDGVESVAVIEVGHQRLEHGMNGVRDFPPTAQTLVSK